MAALILMKPFRTPATALSALWTLEIGADAMNQAVEDLGLTGSYDINGIKTMPGSFNFDTHNINLAWAGVGQFEDQVNPMSMMVYMGAIAGGRPGCFHLPDMGTDAECQSA